MSAIPLPKISPGGVLYATEKQCEWWPDSVAEEPSLPTVQAEDAKANPPGTTA